MEMTLIYTVIGFGLAGYSVIGNDSIQTLGTFIASKQKWFKWYVLASAEAKTYHLNHFCLDAMKVPNVWIESFPITLYPARPKPITV